MEKWKKEKWKKTIKQNLSISISKNTNNIHT